MSDAHNVNYKKIYVTLLILLAISVTGPMIGIKWVTLIAAFGIAVVKADMVIQNFMHLKWERRIAKIVLLASVAIMLVFFFGISPDIMKHTGDNWVNDAAIAATQRGIPRPDSAGTPEEERQERELGIAPPEVGGHEAAAATPGAPAGFNARQTFASNCTPCHGTGGQGNGPVAASLNPKPANFTSAAFWSAHKDPELIKAIRQGGASVGRSASMPAWGSIMTDDQATQMVAYLKTLRH